MNLDTPIHIKTAYIIISILYFLIFKIINYVGSSTVTYRTIFVFFLNSEDVL